MHWDTLGFLAYDYTKNTLRSRGLLCRIVDHIKKNRKCDSYSASSSPAGTRPTTIYNYGFLVDNDILLSETVA